MNDTTTAAQALQALSRSGSARTQVARLRELLPEIEAAQAAGVKHAHILQALNAHGFALSMKSYSVMLHRLRQQRARAVQAPSEPPRLGSQAPPAPADLGAKASGEPQPPAAGAPGATHPAGNATSGAAPAQRPGQPHNFDWEALKNAPPEW